MRVTGGFTKLNVFGYKGQHFQLHHVKLVEHMKDVNIMLLIQYNGEGYNFKNSKNFLNKKFF